MAYLDLCSILFFVLLDQGRPTYCSPFRDVHFSRSFPSFCGFPHILRKPGEIMTNCSLKLLPVIKTWELVLTWGAIFFRVAPLFVYFLVLCFWIALLLSFTERSVVNKKVPKWTNNFEKCFKIGIMGSRWTKNDNRFGIKSMGVWLIGKNG